ncbi:MULTISPECIES: cysteine desulfurase family protein [Bacteroidota]|uniref:cysteine desulfurase n=1 Tax=Sphingobacterium multivorum TaxID=28454 RepID=A0A653ZPA4_SPHMU|nr:MULTISPECIES: cysteine desulfurase family protein [Bacteroidota]VXC56734.1 Cysteine desulfurase IscS [Sphingobacterium multivorum]
MTDTITYLDYNATTPVDERVIDVVNDYFSHFYGNASSLYSFGNSSKKGIDEAKVSIADLLNSEPENIHFTSGATESINLALKGLALHPNNTKKHIITCSTEHKAVLETCNYLESIGFTIDYLPVNEYGVIDLDLLKSSINSDTLLICIMWVNNETGVIHPIEEIGKIANQSNIYFVCDGTQGVGKLPIDVVSSSINILCFSGHKLYAPKGIGAIYIDDSITKQNKIQPLIHGGGQENGLRSGTYNVPLITGLGLACNIAQNEMAINESKIQQLRDYLENELLKFKGAYLNGSSQNRIYNTVNFCIPGFDTEIFIGMNRDIAVSNGSACSSALVQPSHVLVAMGLSNNDAMNSLRISLGKHNTKKDIDLLLRRINDFINI